MLDQLEKEDQISGNRPSRCSPVLKQLLETKRGGFAVGERVVEWVESGGIFREETVFRQSAKVILEIAPKTSIMRRRKLLKPKLLAEVLLYEGQAHTPGAVLSG